MQKILILGSGGYIGSHLYAKIKKLDEYIVYGLDIFRSKSVDIVCNVADLEMFSKILHNYDFDIIMHSLAVKDLIECEEKKQLAWDVNVRSSHVIFEYAAKKNIKIIYVSSDVVFNGYQGNYLETDFPSPINTYGITKYCSELLFLRLENTAICRTALVVGNLTDMYTQILKISLNANTLTNQTLFPHYIYNRLRKKQKIYLSEEIISSPTSIDLVVDGIIDVMKKDIRGILHLTGSQSISRHAFGLEIAKLHNLDCSFIISDNSLNTPIRPRNLSMNNEDTYRRLKIDHKSQDIHSILHKIQWKII